MAAKCQFCGCTEHAEDSIEGIGKHSLHRCARCGRDTLSEMPEHPTKPPMVRIIDDRIILHCRYCKKEIVWPLSVYRSVKRCPDPWQCRTCAEKGRGVRYNGPVPHYIRQSVNSGAEAVPV